MLIKVVYISLSGLIFFLNTFSTSFTSFGSFISLLTFQCLKSFYKIYSRTSSLSVFQSTKTLTFLCIIKFSGFSSMGLSSSLLISGKKRADVSFVKEAYSKTKVGFTKSAQRYRFSWES